jgi:hypothetical protein
MRDPVARSLWLASAALAGILAGCGSATPSIVEPVPGPTVMATFLPTALPSPTAAGTVLRYVQFGDSWPEGAHCGGCRTFADLWADSLKTSTGASIQVTDFMGEREPSVTPHGKESTTLREAIDGDSTVRSAVEAADVILIATGPNEMESIFPALQAGTCGGNDGADCIRALGATWKTNFEAILAEIDELRAGKRTVVRLVDAANPFLSVPEMNEGMPKGFATGNGALIFQLLNDAMCAAAAAYHAVCIDVRPVLNGASMMDPVDENSLASMQAVADALTAADTPELNSP